jgi:hypothetical protein
MKIDIITHCLDYPRLLAHHLSSFFLNPPKLLQVAIHVVCAESDKPTMKVMESFMERRAPPRVMLFKVLTDPDYIRRRSIMRNKLALATTAQLVWFSDADILFGPGALDSLEPYADTKERLLYPQTINVSRDQLLGDAAIARVPEDVGPLDLFETSPADFMPARQTRAIGGSQIVTGATAREFGYCRDLRKFQQPVKQWGSFSDDVAYRKTLGTSGTAINIPGVYRIRHSTRGYLEKGTKL